MQPLPHKNWIAIGSTEFGQPIGVTVHSHKVESFENLLQRFTGDGWASVDNENKQFFLKTLYIFFSLSVQNPSVASSPRQLRDYTQNISGKEQPLSQKHNATKMYSLHAPVADAK